MRPPFLTRFECRIVSYLFQSLTIQCGEIDRIQSDCCSTVYCLSTHQPAASSQQPLWSHTYRQYSSVPSDLWVGGWSSGRLWLIGRQTTASCGRCVPATCQSQETDCYKVSYTILGQPTAFNSYCSCRATMLWRYAVDTCRKYAVNKALYYVSITKWHFSTL